MNSEITEELIKISKPEKVKFQKKVVNTKYPLLGSYLKDIRSIAKKYKNIELIQDEDFYYEEILTRGLIIAYNDRSILEKENEIFEYLRKVDSWALIDSFCSTLKVNSNEREPLFKQLINYLNSEEEFLQRYSMVMFLTHYLKLGLDGNKLSRPKVINIDKLDSEPKGLYIEKILNLINRPFKDYYASFAAAWLGAEAFLFYPRSIIKFLMNNQLDLRTHNFLITKIVDSKITTRDVKEILKSFRRSK